jgi:outer membrane protein
MKPTLYFSLLILLSFVALPSFAQKFGYVDTEFILNKLPEYKKAQAELDKVSEKWQKEIEDKQANIKKLYISYNAEEMLLTEDMRKERMDTIRKYEVGAKELQNKYFGYEGLLFLKRQELTKPVLDKVFKAVQKVAKSKQLAIIFDKSGDIVMIYTDPKHDYTDYVLEALGLGDKNDTVDNKPKQ